jgi:DNA-binding GntR family transcriptional regulator
MTAVIPSSSLVPLYRQVSEQLMAAIMGGQFAPGEALPTESALCAQYGVSRITVRKALDELVERQLIVRRHGVGTFVRESRQSNWSVKLTGLLEEVLAPHRLVVVREALARPPADLLELAQLPPGTKMALFEGTNYASDGSPLMHLCYYFPPHARGLSASSLTGPTPPFRQAEQALGTAVDHARQVIEAAIADGRTSRYLRIPRGTPALRAIRVYHDAAGRPVELLQAIYHPTHYRLTATLYPGAGR